MIKITNPKLCCSYLRGKLRTYTEVPEQQIIGLIENHLLEHGIIIDAEIENKHKDKNNKAY
jgi:hypothetical protein